MHHVKERWQDRWRSLLGLLGRGASEGDPDLAAQIERRIAQSREAHRLVTEGAATIVAAQTRVSLRLEHAILECERVTAMAKEALMLAAELKAKGDDTGAASQERVAEARAARLIGLERDVQERQADLIEATQAADAARAAVSRSATILRERLVERDSLISHLAQARIEEQVQAARSSLDTALGHDVPLIDEVRRTIEERLATARALAELRPEKVDEARARFDQEWDAAQARTRLEALGQPLGLSPRDRSLEETGPPTATDTAPPRLLAPGRPSRSEQESASGAEHGDG